MFSQLSILSISINEKANFDSFDIFTSKAYYLIYVTANYTLHIKNEMRVNSLFEISLEELETNLYIYLNLGW